MTAALASTHTAPGAAQTPRDARAPQGMPRGHLQEARSQHWYVVHTKPRQEEIARENLLRQGYTVYLPRIRLFKHLRGKQQIRLEPLFPRYLFVQPESSNHSIAPVCSTFGVSSLVRFGQQPALIREETLTGIRAFEAGNHEASDVEISPFQPGEHIRIVTGPLRGLEGLVSDVRQERVMVLLHLLGHETRVTLSQHHLTLSH